MNQKNLPVFPEDHDDFKTMAAEKKLSIKDYFHIVVDRLKKKRGKE